MNRQIPQLQNSIIQCIKKCLQSHSQLNYRYHHHGLIVLAFTSDDENILLWNRDIKIKAIEVDGKKIKLYVLDTSGQERYQMITQSYYRIATAIMLVYSVDSKQSFNNITFWMNQIKHHASENISLMLIGNKIEKERYFWRKVKNQPKNLEYSIVRLFFSAKEGTNVVDAFYLMANSLQNNFLNKEISQKQKTQQITPNPLSVIKKNKKESVYDNLQILIIGDSGVGKTNILLRFCANSFQPYHLSNIGIDFKIKKIEEK